MSKDAKIVFLMLILMMIFLACFGYWNHHPEKSGINSTSQNLGIGDVNGFSNYDGN